MEIKSTQNPRIKQVVKLQQNARERKEKGLFVVEGIRECCIAINSGYAPCEVYLCNEIYKPDSFYSIRIDEFPKEIIFQVSSEVYSKMAYRSSVEGIIIVFHSKFNNLHNLTLDESCLLLVLEKVEKPGNLGAIFRTADAAGVSAVLVCDPASDPFNPNTIRSSLGCIFSVPWVITDSEEAIGWLREESIKIISSTPEASKIYTGASFTGKCAVVMGAEDKGLSHCWLNKSDVLVRIPMLGRIDSLNVSVSAAVLLFEAQRQRAECRIR